MTVELNGHVQVDAAETAGASRREREPRSLYPDAASVIRAGIHALSEKAYPWVTLALCAGAFAYTLAEPTMSRITTACLFAVLTHVPTWTLWKRR